MDTVHNINWKNLLKTIEHFKKLGYTYVEVPWLVSAEAIKGTFIGSQVPTLQNLYVVGSAEQSFIQMQLDGILPKGKYVTMSPCFRDEFTVDKLHQLSFMKVELYDTDFDSELIMEYGKAMHDMLLNCKKWFKKLIPWYRRASVKFVNTQQGTDIEIDGIEVGSYGIREYKGVKWIYGTALAEPRFSIAANNS